MEELALRADRVRLRARLTDESEYFRPNFFANTPDILHEYLQHGGRPAFEARRASPRRSARRYGIYSGYEHFENVPVRDGSEEYLHSEKYEIKQRALDGPLLPLIQRLNQIRRENPALHYLSNVTFLETANDALIAYAKQAQGNTMITRGQHRPPPGPGGPRDHPRQPRLPPSFTVHDLLTDERYQWRIGANYVRLEPGVRQAHVCASSCDRSHLMGVGPPTLTHLIAAETAGHAASGAPAGHDALPRPRPGSGSRPSRCGSSARSSTRSTSAASSTPTATAPATSAG